jgi:hypothetical protein
MLPLFIFGCTVSQKITYNIEDIATPPSVEQIPAMVNVRIFKDNRANIESNSLLFNNPRQMKLDGEMTCINSEKNYKGDTVANMITRMMVKHFNQASLFKMSYYEDNRYTDYYITGKLNQFYGQQKFSTAAAVGAQFGLIGALATSEVKTPGKIIIEISDLKLLKKDGTLVKDFGSFYKEYKGEFKADAACWCIYWNMNKKLKNFNSHMIKKIRADMADIELN